MLSHRCWKNRPSFEREVKDLVTKRDEDNNWTKGSIEKEDAAAKSKDIFLRSRYVGREVRNIDLKYRLEYRLKPPQKSVDVEGGFSRYLRSIFLPATF